MSNVRYRYTLDITVSQAVIGLNNSIVAEEWEDEMPRRVYVLWNQLMVCMWSGIRILHGLCSP